MKITGVSAGLPGDRAGVKAADLLVEVDGASVVGLTVNQVINLVEGPENTAVTLGIRRGSETAIRRIKATRALVQRR